MTITLCLPMPPSTNRLWRSTKRGVVYKDVKAAAWCKHAAWAVLQQRKGVTLKGNVLVTLEIEYSEGDADNRIKACLDMLQQGGLLENDKQVVGGTWGWSEDVTGVRLTIEKTNKTFGKPKPKRREICPDCGNAFDTVGRPTCNCDEAVPVPQVASSLFNGKVKVA